MAAQIATAEGLSKAKAKLAARDILNEQWKVEAETEASLAEAERLKKEAARRGRGEASEGGEMKGMTSLTCLRYVLHLTCNCACLTPSSTKAFASCFEDIRIVTCSFCCLSHTESYT